MFNQMPLMTSKNLLAATDASSITPSFVVPGSFLTIIRGRKEGSSFAGYQVLRDFFLEFDRF